MKKKIIIGVIVFIVLSIGNTWFSTLLHNILSTHTFSIVSVIKFGDCMRSIFENKNHLQLFLCIEAFIVLFVILIGLSFRNSYHSDMVKITGKISTPVSAGQSQHGSARWLTEDEKEKEFDTVMLSHDNLSDLVRHGYDDVKLMKIKKEGENNEKT